MRKVAVFGSRKWPFEHPFQFWIWDTVKGLDEQEPTVIVTTEAEGVCEFVSKTCIEMAIPVIVFKPVKVAGDREHEDAYGVEEWRIAPSGSSIVHHDMPTWKDWQSAMNYRSLLMVERAGEGFAFQADKSRGTQFEIDLFEMQGKSCQVLTP